MNKINLYNRGQSFIGIIIVVIIVFLISGGLFFYLNFQQTKNLLIIQKLGDESVNEQKKEQSIEEEINFFSSDKIFNVFQPALSEICLEIAPVFKDESEFLEKTKQDIAEELCFMFLLKYEDALTVNEAEAEKFLSGNYNDKKNKEEIIIYTSALADIGLELPYFPRYFIQKNNKGELSGVQLEIAKRVIKSTLDELLKLLQ